MKVERRFAAARGSKAECYVRALAEAGTITMTPERFRLNAYLTWVFYLPSQVMIILSVLKARKKAAEKSAAE